MPAPTAKQAAFLVLVSGEDEYAIKQRAKEIFQEWIRQFGNAEQEVIDASVTNSGEALKALQRLREALQTLPFFGDSKVIWLQNCNFLGEERTASAEAVTESLVELAQELKTFSWEKVRLLISAGKVDKRKVFYKALDKLGKVESLGGWTAEDSSWADAAMAWARTALRTRQKEISEAALSELVQRVGPNSRQLDSEVEKLGLYVGARKEVELTDVQAVCIHNKTARAFALADALGERNLPRLLQRLDEELWEVKLDPKRSEIGLLYGLISKVRVLLLLKEMLRESWIKTDIDYGRFKGMLERVPKDQLPQDRRFNPLSFNPYILYKTLPQTKRYTEAELVRAMELLLECNRRLVSSSLDEALVLQQTLVQIVGYQEALAGARPQMNEAKAR
jgi:DNA polymerase III subunit delta